MNAHVQDWLDVGPADEIPLRGSRLVQTPGGNVALFKAGDGSIFALNDKCPHKGGPLSQGIVHGRAVTCPLHSWIISLETGEAQGADKGCAHTIAVRVDGGRVLLSAQVLARQAR